MSENVINNTTSVTQTTIDFSDCAIHEKILYLKCYPDLNWADDDFQIARHTYTTMNRSAPNHRMDDFQLLMSLLTCHKNP